MSFLTLFTGAVLTFLVGDTWIPTTAWAQEAKVTYISPAESGQRKGTAPSMQVKLISSGEGPKQYAVIFSRGDEAYYGLLDFAEKYHVISAHFTAIRALSGVVLGWFDPQKKMYRENPIHEQVEVAAMTGDFPLYHGKPALHTHIVVGRRVAAIESSQDGHPTSRKRHSEWLSHQAISVRLESRIWHTAACTALGSLC